MQKLTFITGNVKKAEALALHFHVPVDHVKLDLPEIQSLDLEEVTIAKAQAAYNCIKSPVLVEDMAFTFDALNGLPGPLIKWFLHSIGNEGMCRMLDSYETRGATARICFGYCDGGEVKLFSAERKGTIVQHPRGEIGFGFDPIFVSEGNTKTWGEMDKEEGNTTSICKVALQQLTDFLDSSGGFRLIVAES